MKKGVYYNLEKDPFEKNPTYVSFKQLPVIFKDYIKEYFKTRINPIKYIFKRIKNKDVKAGYILDGYPRNKKQLNYLIKNLKQGEVNVLAILVDVSDKEVRSRLGGRRVCGCGAT